MKRFICSLFLNLLFRWKWLFAAAITFGLHLWLNVPMYFTFIILGFWLISSVIVTIIIMITINTDNPRMYQPSKNPYAKRTEDFYKDYVRNKK